MFQLGVVSARLPPGMGIAHLMGGEDGQHVVMFNTPHPPPGAVYTAQRSHTPILLQNGQFGRAMFDIDIYLFVSCTCISII